MIVFYFLCSKTTYNCFNASSIKDFLQTTGRVQRIVTNITHGYFSKLKGNHIPKLLLTDFSGDKAS